MFVSQFFLKATNQHEQKKILMCAEERAHLLITVMPNVRTTQMLSENTLILVLSNMSSCGESKLFIIVCFVNGIW